MAAKKKKSWFNLLKRLFITDASSGSTKKDKKRRWIFGRFRSKRLASLTAAPSPPKQLTPNADEVKQKCSSSAAEDSSQSSPQSTVQPQNESQAVSAMNVLIDDVPQPHQHQLDIVIVAAVKIQSVFRGYLARKALRALKGLVKLQAIIRGWAVRRQAMNTLKCLQTIINIQSEFCAKRCDLVKTTLLETEKDIKIDSNSNKRWDDSVLSKEEANALSMNRKVASVRRERIKEYWLNHRRSTESEQSKLNVKQRYWLEQWVDSQLAKREDLQNLGRFSSGNAKTREEVNNPRMTVRNLQKHYQAEALDSPIHVPRRSFDRRRQLSIGESGCFIGSPSVPTYMAATESAKAKVRSLSSPRLRPIHFDAYSEINSPYKHKLSPISSINSEATTCSQISRHIAFSQRSPCLKGTPGPIKSSRSFNNDQVNAYG